MYREIDEMEVVIRKQMQIVKKLNSNKLVKLDVGGTAFEVAKETLTCVDGSRMAQLFRGEHQLKQNKNDVIHLERDPEVFADLLKHLRTDMVFMPDSKEERDALDNELNFWGLSLESRLPLTNLYNSPS